MSKTGKEVKTNEFQNYNVIFGSVNNKHPKALYINISAWAEPKIELDVNYSRVIRNLNKQIKQIVFNSLDNDLNNKFIKERTIVDLDIRESGIRYGKRSFMNCELTLFLGEELPVNSIMMIEKLTEITDYIVNKIFDENEIFIFNKKKK